MLLGPQPTAICWLLQRCQKELQRVTVLTAVVLLLLGFLSASCPLLQPWNLLMLICTEVMLGGLEESVSTVCLALCFLAGTPWAKLPEGEG